MSEVVNLEQLARYAGHKTPAELGRATSGAIQYVELSSGGSFFQLEVTASNFLQKFQKLPVGVQLAIMRNLYSRLESASDGIVELNLAAGFSSAVLTRLGQGGNGPVRLLLSR